MDKVFILKQYDGTYWEILDVFSSREAAENVRDTFSLYDQTQSSIFEYEVKNG